VTTHDATCKTEGQDGVAASLLVGLFHSLQHAGLTRRTLINARLIRQVEIASKFADSRQQSRSLSVCRLPVIDPANFLEDRFWMLSVSTATGHKGLSDLL
jgi:hypothetical protein